MGTQMDERTDVRTLLGGWEHSFGIAVLDPPSSLIFSSFAVDLLRLLRFHPPSTAPISLRTVYAGACHPQTKFLVGDTLSLADVGVWGALKTKAATGAVPSNVKVGALQARIQHPACTVPLCNSNDYPPRALVSPHVHLPACLSLRPPLLAWKHGKLLVCLHQDAQNWLKTMEALSAVDQVEGMLGAGVSSA